MKVARLLGNRVLVRRDERPTITAGGIHIPDAHQETAKKAKVLMVGPGRARRKDGTLEPVPLKVDDIVLFNHMTRGTPIGGSRDDDATPFIVDVDELVGVVVEGGAS